MKILSGILGAVAVMALLAGPVWAQSEAIQKYGDPDKEKTPAQIAAEKDAERAYRRSLSNVPEQKATDPWGIARESAPANAAKASPAKPKASKTDSRSADTKPGNTAK